MMETEMKSVYINVTEVANSKKKVSIHPSMIRPVASVEQIAFNCCCCELGVGVVVVVGWLVCEILEISVDEVSPLV